MEVVQLVADQLIRAFRDSIGPSPETNPVARPARTQVFFILSEGNLALPVAVVGDEIRFGLRDGPVIFNLSDPDCGPKAAAFLNKHFGVESFPPTWM